MVSSADDHGTEYPKTVRLQRFLARSGVASRRASENLMTDGRVKVNGEVVTELGSKVNPSCDVVMVDDRIVEWDGDAVVIALNKPVGVVSTMSDPGGKPCVANFVPVDEYPGLYPIGRLDRNTSGLLLFTTDGNLGHALLHPSHHVTKLYEARVRGHMLEEQLNKLRDGVVIDDPKAGKYLTAPADVELVAQEKGAAILHISICEGRYRQVRKMCDAVGHSVIDLKRLRFGPIQLDSLPEGQWRTLEGNERARLYAAAGLAC